MNEKLINDLVVYLDDVPDFDIRLTREERELIIDALQFYKEMQVID